MYEIIYKEKKYFKDLEDGHLYKLGDKFPHDDREITEKRIKFLISKKVIKKIGSALQQQDKQKPKKTSKKKK